MSLLVVLRPASVPTVPDRPSARPVPCRAQSRLPRGQASRPGRQTGPPRRRPGPPGQDEWLDGRRRRGQRRGGVRAVGGPQPPRLTLDCSVLEAQGVTEPGGGRAPLPDLPLALVPELAVRRGVCSRPAWSERLPVSEGRRLGPVRGGRGHGNRDSSVWWPCRRVVPTWQD